MTYTDYIDPEALRDTRDLVIHYDLSLIIPCHLTSSNYLLLDTLIDSINNQEIQDIKCECVFVLDDCEIINETYIRSRLHTRYALTVIEHKNHSAGVSRNIGLGAATGNLIWFLDADDNLLTQIALLTAFLVFKNNQKCIILKVGVETDRSEKPFTFGTAVWQYIFRRELIDGIKFDRFNTKEDDRWFSRVIDKLSLFPDSQFMEIPTKFYLYHYYRENSLTSILRDKGIC